MSERTRSAIAEAVADARAAAGPYANQVLGAAVSAAMTSQSLGGLLQRLFGYAYDAREQWYIYQPVDYPITGSATLNATVTSQIAITQDADFICSKLTECDGVAGNGTNDVSIQLVFSNTDRQFSSQQGGVIATALNGTGQRPYILPKPWLVSRNSRINVYVRSLSANSRSIFIDLHGYKVLDVSALDLTTRR